MKAYLSILKSRFLTLLQYRAAAAAGKDIRAFRLQSFVVGAMLMGLAGALMAQFFKFIAPDTAARISNDRLRLV